MARYFVKHFNDPRYKFSPCMHKTYKILKILNAACLIHAIHCDGQTLVKGSGRSMGRWTIQHISHKCHISTFSIECPSKGVLTTHRGNSQSSKPQEIRIVHWSELVWYRRSRTLHWWQHHSFMRWPMDCP